MEQGQISKNLIDKYGEETLRAGIFAADRRQREYEFNYPSARKAPTRQEEVEGGNSPPLSLPPRHETIKIWPLVMLAAINNKHGGAARLWFIAKSLDAAGSGKVRHGALGEYLADLGVGGRKRRRWMRDALDLGLLREYIYSNGEVVFILAGWGRGAGVLGCSQVGSPARVTAEPLVSPGWRAHVWGGYLATLEGAIISQETKYKITGVDPRTQRNYQSSIAIKRIQNYSNTDLSEPGDIPDRHYFINPKTGEVVQRHPDILVIPSEIARSVPKGRSRKAQSEVNSHTLGENLSYSAAGPNDSVSRLFHETKRGALGAIKRLDEFGEAFWCKNTWENANQWGILVQL